MDLLKRREEILADHAAQEKYDPHWKAEAALGRSLSGRPIAFLCDDEVVVVGDCVAKVLDGLYAFALAAGPAFADPDAARAQPNYKHHAFVRARRLLDRHPTPPAELRVHQQTWNAVACALEEAGVLVVTTEGTFAPGG